METKEYIVSLKRGIDYDAFWNEVESESSTDSFVPSRRVEIINNRDASLRQCHYALTDEEAQRLKDDPRVYDVEQLTKFEPMVSASYTGNFAKTTSSAGAYINWGLRRCIAPTNIYGTNTAVSGDYTYTLDGTGVDVVIQDSGLQVDHPEFQDAAGNSRVQQIDWFAASGVPGTMSVNHYRDTHGHGTHVAGIVAGKNYGWAKNANVYSVKVAGLDGGEGGGLSDPDCFDVITGWHNAKKLAGNMRPTIVNMSWGYGDYFTNISEGIYRGTYWAGTTKQSAYGMIGSPANRHGVRVSYIDVSIQEMIDAGVHVCIAAGNYYQKVDVPGGPDYDNFYMGGQFNGDNPNYYHRGSSPHDDEAFIVGSLDTAVYSATLDQKSIFSESGPGVHIYAPGSNIMSCTSNSNVFGASSYNFYAPTIGVRNNLATNTQVVGSNNYVTFNSIINTYSAFNTLGASLQIGAMDSRLLTLYGGAENGNKSYRMRFTGNSSYSSSSTVSNWEITFWDNNWIELVVERHDGAQSGVWALNDESSTNVAPAFTTAFNTSSLVGAGATPKSVVFTTTDGLTWTTNVGKSVSLVGDVYSLVNSTTTVQGNTGLTLKYSGSSDDSVHIYSVPFTFYAFNAASANPYKQVNISGTSMATPQVCGIGALFLQMEPTLSPAQLRDKVLKNSKPLVYSTGLSNDYTNNRSITNGPNKVIYNPFNAASTTLTSGAITLTGLAPGLT